jgi:hypothetical protein
MTKSLKVSLFLPIMPEFLQACSARIIGIKSFSIKMKLIHIAVPLIGTYDEQRGETLLQNTLAKLPAHKTRYLLLV